MSDQHGQAYTQMEHPGIDTPNLMELAGEGLSFDRCYCSAPLCVPSRMSFLSGKLPAGLGIFDNDSTLPSDMPTIAHALGERGYRTVLIGRMHFKGDDQRHGFDERLVGDITSQFWGTGGAQRTDFGAYIRTTNRKHCLDAVGGGCSPVMAYDEAVFEAAMEYLSRKHDEPLFLIVGFYGPHFPFACAPELYRKYQARFPVEETSGGRCEDVYGDYRQDCSPEKRRDCKAAYCGLVETIDGYVGQLRRLFFEKPGGLCLSLYLRSWGAAGETEPVWKADALRGRRPGSSYDGRNGNPSRALPVAGKSLGCVQDYSGYGRG